MVYSFPIRFLLLIAAVSAYRLNVPRVLLPYHPEVPVSFILEVTHPTGGCFSWRSTRPDIVSVKSLAEDDGCSDRAEIKSVAKPGGIGTSELSAVIFAEEKGGSTTLSCGVTVDTISSISIETTTKVLFVDAAPAKMTVDAFNKDGDRFSTLSEIALDWELKSTAINGEKPLRIVPFEQSTYDAPPEIVKLEKNRKKGFVILIEGVGTGTAQLSAKFLDKYLKDVSQSSVELAVVANLLLVPSQDIYIPLHSTVPFQVLIVKQRGTEVVPMPSSSYHISVSDESILSLDPSSSTVRALVKGSTAVNLLSSYVDVRAKAGLRPPSTAIHVVDAEGVQWHVEGDNWMLQTGKQYALYIEMVDEYGNVMFISDNAKFETTIDETVVKVNYMTTNGTWMIVTPLKPTDTIFTTIYSSILDENGYEVVMNGRVKGEQTAILVDPITIDPPVVYLPYSSNGKMSSINIKAFGGSGIYEWKSGDENVFSIDSSTGLLIANGLGDSFVRVTDKRNKKLQEKANVHVIGISGIGFGETVRETFVHDILTMNVRVFGLIDGQQVEMSDCTNVQFDVNVPNLNILKPLKDFDSKIPTEGTGCGTISLEGLSSGDTKVNILLGEYRATIDVSVYDTLKVSSEEVALGLGSEHKIYLSGGPRPWYLDPASFYRKDSGASSVNIKHDNEEVLFKCGGVESMETVCTTVGNSKSNSLPFPVSSEVCVNVCCANPVRIEVYQDDNRMESCPNNVNALLTGSRARLFLKGHGVCGGSKVALQSINGAEVKWKSADSNMIKIEKSGADLLNVWTDISSRNKEGTTKVLAEIVSLKGFKESIKPISVTYDITVTDGVRMSPSKLVLWNEDVSKGTLRVIGGSGHFLIDDFTSVPHAPIAVLVQGRDILVSPRTQGQITIKIRDSCINGQVTEAHVRVADIHSLDIIAPQFVQVGQEVEVSIVAQDETGITIDNSKNKPLADATLETNNDHGVVRKVNGLNYVLRADSIGTLSLSATARSSSGRILTSRPKTIQIFSPMSLYPKKLTLIPESVFQLEVVGGPQPTPPIRFALNNTKVASVLPNALITSNDLGYTSMTGTVNIGDGQLTQDTVVVRVVSLSGIVLSASARRVEAGGRVNVRLRGTVMGAENEEPFAFGGAIYPFKVTWTVSDPSVLQPTHPLGSDVSETSENQFAIWFDAMKTGAVVVKAHVELHKKAKKHFSGSMTSFDAEISVKVESSFGLAQPSMEMNAVRVAPNSNIQLTSTWASSMFSVPSEYSNRIRISSNGLLTSLAKEGTAAVLIRKLDSSDNETALVPITISRVYSLDIVPSTELRSSMDKSPLIHLPVGAQINLNIYARDVRGRRLATAPNVNYRPHRFDLTDITGSNNNQSLSITLKSAGETVIRISESANNNIATFLRLSASESILPPSALKYSNDLLVSDLICLQANILSEEGTRWESKSSSEGMVYWLDDALGVGQFSRAGDVFVKLHTDSQSIHSKISIRKPSALRFNSKVLPQLVTNKPESSYLFGVTAVTNNTSERKISSIYGDCSNDQEYSMEGVRAPFECYVSFVKKSKTVQAINWLSVQPVFKNKIGYACEVRRLDDSVMTTSLSIPDHMDVEQYNVQVTSRWVFDSTNVAEAVTTVPFHFAFEVIEEELVFSNMEQGVVALSIWSPKYDIRNVVVKTCEGDILSMEKLYSASAKHSQKGNLFYNVRLNVKSAALFSDHARKCKVRVENTNTGQVVEVPVTIQILDETAKQVYNALESRGLIDFMLLLAQKYSTFIPTMLWTCIVGLIILAISMFVKMTYWDKPGSFNDTTMQSLNQTSIASSLSSTANYSIFGQNTLNDSPIFRSTPIAGSPQISFAPRDRLRNSHIGSTGDSNLWSSDKRSR